jgi:cell filamentation protein
MKQRLLVMNGQRLVQSEDGGQWSTNKVEKAGGIKPGIYNIHLSVNADKSKNYDGVILYTDKDFVYQQVGKSFVKHNLVDFEKVPEIGTTKSIGYDAKGKATVTNEAVKLSRGRSM